MDRYQNKTVNKEGKTAMSDIARSFFGKWITNKDFASLKPVNVFHRQNDFLKISSHGKKNSHVLFRREFFAEYGGRYKIYISADDYYKLYINGSFVCQGPAPGYPQHYYFNEQDVSAFIKEGKNVIAVHTYYQGLINRVWVSGDDRHGLILDLLRDDVPVLCSDETFRVAYHSGYEALHTVGYETQFMERYLSTAPEVDFMLDEFDDSAWETASIATNADHELFLQPSKMLTFEKIVPVSINREGNELVIDFGKIYVGYLCIDAKGKPGDVVKFYYGQELDNDRKVRHLMRANCDYREEWVLSGGNDSLSQFDYKSFRYVRIELPDGCELSEVRLNSRHYPFTLNAEPCVTDRTLLQIWGLCIDSLKYGVQEVIQDCMEREKGNYLGDGCSTALAFTIATGDTSVLKKLIDDSLRSSFIDRGLVTCAACSFMQEIAEYPLMMYYSLYSYYQLSGDKEYLARHYDALADVLDYYREKYSQEDGLLANIDKWCVVEWPANYRDGYDVDLTEGQICKTKHTAINAHYIGALKYMNKISKLLGKPDYADTKPLEEAFVAAFYDEKTGLYRDSEESSHISTVANVFSFMYGIFPKADTHEKIISFIEAKGYDSVMLFGAYPYLAGLKSLGLRDKVYDYIRSEKTWGRMLKEGLSRTSEGWGKDTKWNTSLYHLVLCYAVVFLCDWEKFD